LETRGRGRSQGLSKIFRAAIYRAHRAVVFAIAQLSCMGMGGDGREMEMELLLLLLLLLSEHLYSALSLNKITNVLHALCQYVANRKHLSECLKESKVSVSTVMYSVRLFHGDGSQMCADGMWME